MLAALTGLACSRSTERSPAPGTEYPSTTTTLAERASAPAPETLPPPREIAFTTEDGAQLAATLQPAARPDAPLVILVHQIGSTRAEWEPLLGRLRLAPSIATLALDLRGHGASTATADGETLAWRDFDADAWPRTASDVRAAVAFARSDASGIAPRTLAVVGSSIGSSAAIAAAATEPGLGVIVALSPGRAYHGFDAITPATELGGRRFLAVVAEAESDAVDTARAMARITESEPVIVPGSAHGVALLAEPGDVLDRVERFLRDALGAPRPDATR
jgi:pimeloyl-ACP methyl ester carboxylesterase